MGFGELIQDKYKDDEEIEIILSEAKRLLRLSEETLLYSSRLRAKRKII